MGPENGAVAQGDVALVRRLLGLARPHTKLLLVLLLLDLLGSVGVLLTPLPLKIAIDSVLGSQPLPSLLADLLPEALTTPGHLLGMAVGLVLLIALVNNLPMFAGAVLRGYVGERLVLDFRSALFRRAQRLSLSYHDAAGTADTVYRIEKDANAVEDLLIDSALSLTKAVLTVGIMFSVTLWIDWQLGLIAAVVGPFLLLLSARYRPRLRQQSRAVKKLESEALGIVQEVLSVLRVVKAFGQEEREQERFERQCRAGVSARVRLLLAEGVYGAAIRLTTAVGTAAVLFIGVMHVQRGALTLGDLLLVLTYLAQLYEPLKTISRKAGGLQSHLTGVERAFALLDQPTEVEETEQARPLERAVGAIAFRSVSFGYKPERSVLRDVSLDVAPATCLGIVGATGAGKSTLLNLLMRLYDPAEGTVLLDGRDVRGYRLADLRQQFAVVSQDVVLFSTSVAENIAYARPGASREEIEAAARSAQAHDFILQLPQGYDTRVGERGMCLSGGERQRIALARAFLKDAPVLLLDEPTSAVDAETEAAILEAMEVLMRGRTSILITHRQAPLLACDRVLALEDGRVVTAPRPEELLAVSRQT